MFDQQVLYDKKWRRFLAKTWLFRYIPFVEFAFGSGSLAVGNVDEESDYDVLIGARSGKIFTARFCAALFFGLFGWRRAKTDHSDSASDKVCLNHFVTPEKYYFALEKNEYWKKMYQGLAPVYGQPEKIEKFFGANQWAAPFLIQDDLRHLHSGPSRFKLVCEKILSGYIGNRIEKMLKGYQIGRIERGAIRREARPLRTITMQGSGQATCMLPPLVVYSDTELEFHPDPVMIEIVP